MQFCHRHKKQREKLDKLIKLEELDALSDRRGSYVLNEGTVVRGQGKKYPRIRPNKAISQSFKSSSRKTKTRSKLMKDEQS
jgi:hypothetical protein